ncbi:MAG: hypothetical protein ACKOOL_01050, partial [Novosphingobium sp.]
MQYDDRLATVLRMRADSEPVRRIQLRQLIDLLGTYPSSRHSPQIDAAYVRLGELNRQISPTEGAALLRDPALRLRNPRLVAALASSDARRAAEAVQRAELGEEEWLDLIPALSGDALQALHQRKDLSPALRGLLDRIGVRGRGLPAAASASAGPEVHGDVSPVPASPPPQPETVIAPEAETQGSQDGANRGERIGAIVKRIEAYRKAKQVVEQSGGDAPRLPLGEEHVLSVT